MSVRGQPCAYCGAPAVNADHVVPSAHRRKLWSMPFWKDGRWARDFCTERGRGAPVDPTLLDTVPACFECNVAKGARLLIPPSWADRLDELNALGIGTFRVWHGDAESLRMVVR